MVIDPRPATRIGLASQARQVENKNGRPMWWAPGGGRISSVCLELVNLGVVALTMIDCVTGRVACV